MFKSKETGLPAEGRQCFFRNVVMKRLFSMDIN